MKLKEFLWFLAGANIFILKTAPTDQSKFGWVGIIILLTAIIASFTGGYALYGVFQDGIIAIGAGLLWGLFILSIDCLIISTLGRTPSSEKSNTETKSPGIKKITFPVIVRISLSILIGFIIAKPLEFRIFEEEIKDQRVKIRLKECQYNQDITNQKLKEEYTSNKAKIDSGQKELERLGRRDVELQKGLNMERVGEQGTYTLDGEILNASGERGTGGTNPNSTYNVLLRDKENNRKKQNEAENEVNRLKKRNEELDTTISDESKRNCDAKSIRESIDKKIPTILEAYVALQLYSSPEEAAKEMEASEKTKSDSLHNPQRAIQDRNTTTKKPIVTVKEHNVNLEHAVFKASMAGRVVLFFTIFIIMIEISPVLVKLFQNPEEYNKRLNEYLEDIQGTQGTKTQSLSYLELIEKYPFLSAKSLKTQYKKTKEIYEELVPDLEKINELKIQANTHFTILNDQSAIDIQTAKEVHSKVAEDVKTKEIIARKTIHNKLLTIWERKYNDKIKEEDKKEKDPDEFVNKFRQKNQQSKGQNVNGEAGETQPGSKKTSENNQNTTNGNQSVDNDDAKNRAKAARQNRADNASNNADQEDANKGKASEKNQNTTNGSQGIDSDDAKDGAKAAGQNPLNNSKEADKAKNEDADEANVSEKNQNTANGNQSIDNDDAEDGSKVAGQNSPHNAKEADKAKNEDADDAKDGNKSSDNDSPNDAPASQKEDSKDRNSGEKSSGESSNN